MSKMYNRTPLAVDTDIDMDYKFFNHINWKGVNVNKNFLSVDQETFEDAQNVYMDAEGLLKSRPAIKIYNDTKLENILNMWTFPNVSIYLTGNIDSQYVLHFIRTKTNDTEILQISSDNFKLVLSDEKVFIFLQNAMIYYDNSDSFTGNSRLFDAESLIYVPTTKYIIDGVQEKGEKSNILTSSYYTQYKYSSIDKIDTAALEDNKIKIVLDDKEYEVLFKPYTQYSFVSSIHDISDDQLAPMSFEYEYTKPLMSVSRDGHSMILYSFSLKPSGNTVTAIWHSVTGTSFESIDLTSLPYDIIDEPVISQDGTFIAVILRDGIYVKSVLGTEESGTLLYSDWTNLSKLHSHTGAANFLSSKRHTLSCYDYDNIVVIEFSEWKERYFQYYKDDLGNKQYISRENDLSFVTSGVYDNVNLTSSQANITIIVDGDRYKLNIVPSIDGLFSVYMTDYDNNILLEYLIDDTSKAYTDVVFTKNGSFRLKYSIDTLTQVTVVYTAKYFENAEADLFYSKPISHINNLGQCIYMYDCNFVNKPVSTVCISRSQSLTYQDFIAHTELDAISSMSSLYISNDVYYVAYSTDNKVLLEPFKLHFSVNTNDTWSSSPKTLITVSNRQICKMYNEYNILTNEYLRKNDTNVKLLFDAVPVAITDNSIFVYNDNLLYKTLSEDILISKYTQGKTNYIVPTHVAELDNFYFAIGQKLYISEYTDAKNFEWYFPNEDSFDDIITNLHPISNTEIAVFFTDSIYYISKDVESNLYKAIKSKFGVGCEQGSDVITTSDGKTIIFSSSRGLVAMSYQDFIASTEQSLTYLSDAIFSKYKEFNIGAIKLYQYDYWIICYRQNHIISFVFDIRNNSFWPEAYSQYIYKIITADNVPLILSNNKLYRFDTSDNNYKDSIGKISWFILSQKLHLNAINYNKHLISFTLASVNDNSNPCSIKLEIRNYRKKVDYGKTEIIEYEVDVIRTFVKRVNYSKVTEFQYKLSADIDNAIQVPLALSNLSLKYNVTGVVR